MPEERESVTRIQSLEKKPPVNRNRRNKQPSNSYKFKGLTKSTEPVLKSYLSSTTPETFVTFRQMFGQSNIFSINATSLSLRLSNIGKYRKIE